MYLKEIPCINKVTIPYHTKQVGGREGGGDPRTLPLHLPPLPFKSVLLERAS